MRRRELGLSEIVRSMAVMVGSGVNEESFAELLELGGAAWAGRPEEDLEEMGLRIFQRNVADRIYPGDPRHRGCPPAPWAHRRAQFVGVDLPGPTRG